MSRPYTVIHYFVPEDLDDQEILNGFTISKTQDEITLKDIQKNFPLQGQYIFRFRYQYEKKQYLWLDIQSNSTIVPTTNNKIVMKATRVSWDNKQQEQQQQQKKPVQQQKTQEDTHTNYHKSLSNQSNSKPQPQKPIQQVHAVHSDDLLDFSQHQGHAPTNTYTNSSNNNTPHNHNHQNGNHQNNNNNFAKKQNQNDLMNFDDMDNNNNTSNNNSNQNHGSDLLDL